MTDKEFEEAYEELELKRQEHIENLANMNKELVEMNKSKKAKLSDDAMENVDSIEHMVTRQYELIRDIKECNNEIGRIVDKEADLIYERNMKRYKEKRALDEKLEPLTAISKRLEELRKGVDEYKKKLRENLIKYNVSKDDSVRFIIGKLSLEIDKMNSEMNELYDKYKKIVETEFLGISNEPKVERVSEEKDENEHNAYGVENKEKDGSEVPTPPTPEEPNVGEVPVDFESAAPVTDIHEEVVDFPTDEEMAKAEESAVKEEPDIEGPVKDARKASPETIENNRERKFNLKSTFLKSLIVVGSFLVAGPVYAAAGIVTYNILAHKIKNGTWNPTNPITQAMKYSVEKVMNVGKNKKDGGRVK